ncbi:hypothetical protein B0H19DRAFT_1250087 [Mycena capillaripes]|nr:hypothetical protein B0H19DRAFT_1250087 [Mycena capillaripes]
MTSGPLSQISPAPTAETYSIEGALRRPFWLQYCNYENCYFDTSTPNADNALRTTFEQIRANFRVYLQNSKDEQVAWTPTGPQKKIRKRAEASPTLDNLAELQQADFSTAARFLHELGHVLWHACGPYCPLALERGRALIASRAIEGQSEIEVALWGGIVDLVLVAPGDIPDVPKPQFYDFAAEDASEADSLVPDYNGIGIRRHVCVVRFSITGGKYLTCPGASAPSYTNMIDCQTYLMFLLHSRKCGRFLRDAPPRELDEYEISIGPQSSGIYRFLADPDYVFRTFMHKNYMDSFTYLLSEHYIMRFYFRYNE